MSEDLRHWLLKSSYTLEETPLLLAGIDPKAVCGQVDVATHQNHPRAAKARFYQDLLTEEVQETELGQCIFNDEIDELEEFTPDIFRLEIADGVFMPNFFIWLGV